MNEFVGMMLAFLLVALALHAIPEFRLEDQFRSIQTPELLFTGTPVVLVAGDQRKTDRHIQAWGERLQIALGNRVRVIGLSNLRGLPFFVSKNSVRSSLKKNLPKIPVLCDWNGSAYKQFGFIRGQVNAHVFAVNRNLIGSLTGTPSEDRVQTALALIERSLSHK